MGRGLAARNNETHNIWHHNPTGGIIDVSAPLYVVWSVGLTGSIFETFRRRALPATRKSHGECKGMAMTFGIQVGSVRRTRSYTGENTTGFRVAASTAEPGTEERGQPDAPTFNLGGMSRPTSNRSRLRFSS